MYMEMINVMRKFMITNHMVKHLQVRMNQYLIARWLDCKGMNYKDLYRDAPKQLFEEFQVKKYSKILYTNQIFHVSTTSKLIFHKLFYVSEFISDCYYTAFSLWFLNIQYLHILFSRKKKLGLGKVYVCIFGSMPITQTWFITASSCVVAPILFFY